MTLTCQGHVTSSTTWPFDCQVAISYRCSCHRVSICSHFRDIGHQTYWGHDVNHSRSRDHSIPRWPFPISAPLSSSIYLQPFPRYWAVSTLSARPWPFRVTWRHRSHDRLIPKYPFPIGAPLSLSHYLQPFSRYWPLSVLGSRPWPFRVTWRHRSCTHPIPRYRYPFPIGAPLSPSRYLQPFPRFWALSILGHDLDHSESRDVIGHVTIWFPGTHFL